MDDIAKPSSRFASGAALIALPMIGASARLPARVGMPSYIAASVALIAKGIHELLKSFDPIRAKRLEKKIDQVIGEPFENLLGIMTGAQRVI